MTREEILSRYPRASESFLKANLTVENSRENPKLEFAPSHDSLETHPSQEGSTGKLHIRFISHRQRLCDPDNLSVKWLLDCLRYCGAIAGDEPEKITLEVTQQKVKLKSDEFTEILIEAYDG